MADKFQLKALITGVDRLSPMLAGVQKNAMALRKKLGKSGLGNISFGEIATGGAIAAPFIAGVKAAMEFESRMADVKKVVDYDSPAQFKQMGKDVLELSTRLPMAAEGIAQIVAAGGQAGIPRAELMGFASDAVKMGVAFDQTAEESGKMMATWRTAFRMGQADVVTLADKINYLGNTGPASTKQISAIVTQIGPLGEVAGMASGQIAAMGATLAGVGIAEEVASTGMKNFMLTLTSGAAATKKQQETFRALRLDSRAVAKGMQQDAQGTIMRVLTAVSQVEKSQQASVLTQLFGKESIGAIAPMLTNLELLRENFGKVGDATKYAGSMNKEYAARAETTENNLQLLKSRVTQLGITVGSVLLPPFNQFMDVVGPLIGKVVEFADAHPGLIKGIMGAVVAFGAMRMGILGVSLALKLMSLNPIMLAITGIALAAGLVVANWDVIGPFFSNLWERIKGYAQAGWELFKKVASFTPMGLIMQNWGPIVAFFQGLWDKVGPIVRALFSAPATAGQSTGAAYAQMINPGARQSPLGAAQAAQRQQVNGEINVRFSNPPPGTTVQTQSQQSGVKLSSDVGRRSLAGSGY